MNEILNLNTQTLINNRHQALYTVIQALKKKGKNSAWSIYDVYKKIKTYNEKENGKYKPYCQTIVYFLNKRFKKELTRIK